MNTQYGNGVGQDIYDGAAAYGRIRTTIVMIFGILIAIILLIFGIKRLRMPDYYQVNTNAIIVTPDCKTTYSTENGRQNTYHNCILDIKYTADGKEYLNKLNTSGKIYSANQSINIRYNLSNPMDITTAPTNKTFGIIMISIGLIISIFVIASWYIAQKSKLGASMIAASDTIDLFRPNRY